MVPIDTLPRHPGGWDARVKGTLQHLLRAWRFGRTEALGGNACALAARYVVGPFLRESARTIEQDMAMGPRRGQTHPKLAIVHATGCPALVACHPHRRLACFEQSRLIDDEHGLGSPQMLGHIRAQSVAEGIGIPLSPAPQMRHAIGRRIAMHFRPLPAIFPRHGAEEASDRGLRTAPGGAAGKAWQQMAFHLGQPERPCTYRL